MYKINWIIPNITYIVPHVWRTHARARTLSRWGPPLVQPTIHPPPRPMSQVRIFGCTDLDTGLVVFTADRSLALGPIEEWPLQNVGFGKSISFSSTCDLIIFLLLHTCMQHLFSRNSLSFHWIFLKFYIQTQYNPV